MSAVDIESSSVEKNEATIDDDEDNSNVPKNEHYYISEILKLIKETNDFPLFIYSMLKTLLQKKHLLNDAQIKEISEILNIKPVVKEVVKYKEKHQA